MHCKELGKSRTHFQQILWQSKKLTLKSSMLIAIQILSQNGCGTKLAEEQSIGMNGLNILLY